MLETLEPRLLLDSSGIWHQVEIDENPGDGIPGIVYDINLTTTGDIEDLRGHPLTAAHFDQGLVTAIWVTDNAGHLINDGALVESILATAQNAVYLKQTPNLFEDVVGFINGNELTEWLLDDSGTYGYRSLPGHESGVCGAMLNSGMDTYNQRRSYYLDAIVELVAQPARYAQIESQGLWPGLLQSFEDIDKVASLPADARLLQGGIVNSLGVLGIGKLIPNWNSEWAWSEYYWDCWQELHPTASGLLQDLGFVFKNIGTVGEIGGDVVWWLTTDALVKKPEAHDRYLALKEFMGAYSARPAPYRDQALIDAFSNFEVQWLHHIDYYGQDLITAIRNTRWSIGVDKVMDIVSLGGEWSKILELGGAAKMVASGLSGLSGYLYALNNLVDFWQDLDRANIAAASATLGSYIADELGDDFQDDIDISGVISAEVVNRNSRLASSLSYSGYAYYMNLAESLRRNMWDPEDWLTYLIATGAGHNPDQKVRHFEDSAEYCLSYTDARPYTNQFILPYQDYYGSLLDNMAIADIQVQGIPSGFSNAGEPVHLDVTLENIGLVGTQAKIMVEVRERESGLVTTVYHSSLVDLPPGVPTSSDVIVSSDGLAQGSYDLTVHAINYGSATEQVLENNSVTLSHSVGTYRPNIFDRIPDVSFPRAGTFTIDLSKHAHDPDTSVDQLIWTASFNGSNLEVEILNGEAVISSKAGWIGEDKVIFEVTDPQDGSDSQEITVSVFHGTELQNPSVTPSSGEKGDMFTFSVTYLDPEGKEPEFVCVMVSGSLHNMQNDGTDISTGRLYWFETNKLVSSENHFYFHAFDGKRDYRTDVINGPELAELHDLGVGELSVYPEEPQAGDTVEVKARVENLGTVPEEDLSVRFLVNGVEQGDATLDMMIPGETSALLAFPWTIPVLDYEETYELSIEVDVVTGESDVENNSSITSVAVKPPPGAVEGWVLDEWDLPVAGAEVRVVQSPAGSYGSAAKTDQDGYFFLDGLAPTHDPQASEEFYVLEISKESVGEILCANIDIAARETLSLPPEATRLTESEASFVTSGRNLRRCEYSPDGTRIAFVESVDFPGEGLLDALYVINEDGSGRTRYTGPDKDILEAWNDTGSLSWSRDGNTILLVDVEHQAWKIPTNSGNAGTDATTVISDSVNSVSWSDDGSQIAYSSRADKHIWQADSNGANPTQLSTSATQHYGIAWSPDDNMIAFTDNMSKLWLMDVGDKSEVLIVNGSVREIEWLADSSCLLYEWGGDIWLYDLGTEEHVQITYEASTEKSPAVPREGDPKLAFASDNGMTGPSEFGLFTMPFERSGLYFTDVNTSSAIITPNSDGVDDYLTLNYTISLDANVTVKIHDSHGNLVRTLLDDEFQTAGAHAVQWDGKDEYGNQENAEVYSYRLDMHDASHNARSAHGRVSMVKDIRELGTDVLYPRWSPDGTKMVYVDTAWGGGQLWIADAPDGTNKQLVPTDYEVGRRPAWTSDGLHIVFPSYVDHGGTGNFHPQIAMIGLDGSGYTELTTRTLDGLLRGYSPSMSPAGDAVVFAGIWDEPEGYEWYITTVNADGSNVLKLFDHVGGIGHHADSWPVWSPDGTSILFSADMDADTNGELYLMNADGSGTPQQLVSSPFDYRHPEFTSDGQRILFGSYDRMDMIALWTAPLDESEHPRAMIYGFEYAMPSPEGDQLLMQNYVADLFLSLTKGAIEGQILDHETLLPLVDSSVMLHDSQTMAVIATATTNEQGGYQFYNIEPGSYTVTAVAESYIDSQEIAVDAHPWVVNRGVDFKLQPLPSVEVAEVVDGQTIGSLIPIHSRWEAGEVAQVRYEYRQAGGEWQDIGTTYYGVPGMFDTDGLVSGDYEIRATGIDALGNEDESPDVIGITIDHTAPSAWLNGLADGLVVSGVVALTADSNDPDVASVVFQYRRAGDVLWVNVGSIDTEGPWGGDWDATHLLPGSYELRAVAADAFGNVDEDPQVTTVHVAGSVVGRHVFYNHSAWDGNDAGASAADDAAIATDKQALLPGETATFANYTSYSRGINGIMIDVDGLDGTPTASDFVFKTGNSNDPSAWTTAPAPLSITVRAGEGAGDSDRVTIIWADNDLDGVADPNEAVAKQWLQVTVLSDANGGSLGLTDDDVFYFGNAVGETGNSATDTKVNATDKLVARNNPHTFLDPAPLDDICDFDRDQKVNATDELIARNNGTTFLTDLELITVPAATGGAGSTMEMSLVSEPLVTADTTATPVEPLATPSVGTDETVLAEVAPSAPKAYFVDRLSRRTDTIHGANGRLSDVRQLLSRGRGRRHGGLGASRGTFEAGRDKSEGGELADAVESGVVRMAGSAATFEVDSEPVAPHAMAPPTDRPWLGADADESDGRFKGLISDLEIDLLAGIDALAILPRG